MALPAQTLTTVHSFGRRGQGLRPNKLVQATDGNFYGTTYVGGVGACPRGCGTVFKITPGGSLKTLYSFCTQGEFPETCPDGYYPVVGLLQAANGDIYGTTSQGGANGSAGGTVFKITPAGKLTTLYGFCSQVIDAVCTDGLGPQGLVQATGGDFFGTTQDGGAYNRGTAFKITPDGKLTRLYSFCSQGHANCTDGAAPEAAVIQAADGDFYGTTNSGGAYGQGTVFSITPSGKLTTLYSFCPQAIADVCPDGQYPETSLVQAANGDFYGTTFYGGANGNYGTVFQITPSGVLTTLYSFCSETDCTDGADPALWLVLGNGEIYGTTGDYGANGQGGTIFKITPAGPPITLYSFCSQGVYPACTDGEGPGSLIQAANGDFYGTTFSGGANQICTENKYKYGCGTIFSLSPSPDGAVRAPATTLAGQ
jgi:uncharacterized repeat protein (TIGR03803 family)